MSGSNASPDLVDSQGMNYLVSLPRRVVTVYVPLGAFLLAAIMVSYFGLQRRAWQQGGSDK